MAIAKALAALIMSGLMAVLGGYGITPDMPLVEEVVGVLIIAAPVYVKGRALICGFCWLLQKLRFAQKWSKGSRFRLKHCSILYRQHIRTTLKCHHRIDPEERTIAMYAATNVHISTEFYGSCLITSQPKSVSNMWVPYAFVAWREHGMVQFHRFPELDTLLFSTETEAISAGFLIGRSWADKL